MGLGDHRRKKRQGQGLKPAHEQLAPLQNSRTSESSDSPSSRQADPLFFSPPGNVQDFANSNEGLAGWSETLDKTVEDIIQRKQDKKKDIFFYNPARTRPTTASERQIRWRAFPKNQETKIDMWKNADIRLNQDEYCEWEVKRRHDNELLSVTFTCETPEYWEYLSKLDDGQHLVELYSKLNGNAHVTKRDLFEGGKYNPKNRWNCRGKNDGGNHETKGGIAHMIRDNNYLAEAAELVADATIRVPGGYNGWERAGPALLRQMQVSEESPTRHSDPQIVECVNRLAREGKFVTMRNPVGLYIDSFEKEKIKANRDINMWKIERKSADDKYVLRATFEIPEDLVGKLKDDKGNKIYYGSHIAQYVWITVFVEVADGHEHATSPDNYSSPIRPIFTYIEGRHIKPTKLPTEIVSRDLRREPFGNYLATTEVSKRAITLDALLATLKDHTWIAYAADEGIGCVFKTPRTEVRVRLVVVCTPGYQAKRTDSSKMADGRKMVDKAFKDEPTFAVVVVPPSDDPNNMNSDRSILQVASYSPSLGWFNFYDRERTLKSMRRWLYFGSSNDAFTPDTQGLGPFCGHANGGLVMKEADSPWPHWHSPVAELELEESHPIYKEKLFRNHTGWLFGSAHELATMIMNGTTRWFNKRRDIDFGPEENRNPTAVRVHQWIAHVCLTTTVNISCSGKSYNNGQDKEGFKIPSGFFFNSTALGRVIDGVAGLESDIHTVSWKDYMWAKNKLSLHTVAKFSEDQNGDIMAVNNEGQAPWKIVSPSGEDMDGIDHVLAVGLLPRRVVAAILLVDFWNPVFSYRRAQLMRYIPSTATLDTNLPKDDDRYNLGVDLIEVIENAITDFELGQDSPEAEFIGLVKQEDHDLYQAAKDKLQIYVKGINEKLKTQEGVLEYMRVAETKRRIFRPPPKMQRPVHPLAEFDMSLPYASRVPLDGAYTMKPDGTVEELTPPAKIWHPRNIQSHFSSAGCPFSASF